MTHFLSSRFFVFLITSGLILYYGCARPTERSQEYELWSSSNPLSENYRVRQQKYSQGNLVHNPSFESGKVKQVDSLTQSIVIEGWDFVGQNIRWLKTLADSVSAGNPYIHQGNRSIKIVRKEANETDEIGDGVISDYIRVIPGNYNLSMYLNLIDIENPKSRLGTGIYDAVDIRIIYYDKNKITLSGKQYSPYYNNYFNNAFKGESLSKFDRIDSTGWIHVQGRSHQFPVPDGDLQDNAKYVRIFIGLKGKGTLYIDDVEYKYTRWNFTQLERLENYFDTTFSLCHLIIPQPRSVKVLESIIYYRPYYEDVFPVILIPEQADKITVLAAKELETHIQETIAELTNMDIDSIPGLITSRISEQIRQSTVTYSIGKTNLFRTIADKSPLEEISGQEQGFMVYTLKDDLNVIYLVGNSPISDFYAVQTAIQLFDNRRLLFHNANIVDYPKNTVRPLLLSELDNYGMAFLEKTKATRFNEVYLPAANKDISENLDRINTLGTYSVSLYTNLNSSNGNISFPEDFNRLIRYKNNLKTTNIAIINESFEVAQINQKQHSSCDYCEHELMQLANSAVTPLEIQLDKSYTDIICSDFFQRNYTRESTFKNVSFIWTGNGNFTWKLDEADYLYNALGISDKMIFMDMTLFPGDRSLNYFMYDSLWPNKLAKASLFESYDNEVLPEIYNRVDKTILAFKAGDLFDIIRLQTASDYLWNPDMYNPDLSLYRALITTLGVRLTKDLLYLNDFYFKARSELILAESPKNYQKHIRRADVYIKEIKTVQSNILTHERINQYTSLSVLISGLIEELDLKREQLTAASANIQ